MALLLLSGVPRRRSRKHAGDPGSAHVPIPGRVHAPDRTTDRSRQPTGDCGQFLSSICEILPPMLDTSARLLALLSLLQARATWSGSALAERLEVDTRTVRR